MMLTSSSQPQGYSQLYDLVELRLGFKLKENDLKRLHPYLDQLKLAKHFSMETYVSSLRSNTATDSTLWQALVNLLSNNESFFFRDAGLFALLRTKILPELLEKNSTHRQLRIWSAGCSRGEEIYSIAMTLLEILPSTANWSLHLYGSDVDRKVLDTASQGLYSNWSLRSLDEERKHRYFTPHKEQWRLNQQVRDMVRFHHLNLVDDQYPVGFDWCAKMDLILCRNVFIYFSPQTVAGCLQKIEQCLAADGIFISGHGEFSSTDVAGLTPEILPGSMIYRRGISKHVAPVLFAHIDLPKPLKSLAKVKPFKKKAFKETPVNALEQHRHNEAPISLPPRVDVLQLAISKLQLAAYQEALDVLINVKADSIDIELSVCKLKAQCLANLGKYEQALVNVQAAMSIDAFSAELYFLQSHILELQGDIPQTIIALEKCIYLDSNFIAAYIELAHLLEQQERNTRARRLRLTAESLLGLLPPDKDVFPYNDITAGELSLYLAELA